MGFLDFLKDSFGGPDTAFEKLQQPNFFLSQRASSSNLESYAMWLREKYAYYGSMAVSQIGIQIIPQFWIDGIQKIEEEIGKVKKEGGPNLFPPDNGSKISDELKAGKNGIKIF